MGSLYNSMRKGGNSYGVVPGNGNPKADDKTMQVGPGHVVPHENVSIAKKIVKKLGYDPDVKVDMNQGKKFADESIPIKISSKEYFLNEDQVNQMKQVGIDPEMLSPNSPYNQRVDGGTTKQVKDMVNEKLNMFELMSNNNNQYPAYQDGGGTRGTQGYPREFVSALGHSIYGDNAPGQGGIRGLNVMAEREWPKYLKGESEYQHLDMSPDLMSKWDPETGGLINTMTDPGAPEKRYSGMEGTYTSENIGDFDYGSVPAFSNPNYQRQVQHQLESGNWGLDASDPDNPYTYRIGSNRDPNYMPELKPRPLTEIPTGADPSSMSPIGLDGKPISGSSSNNQESPEVKASSQENLSPEDQHLKDLIDKSQQLEDQEVAANMAMGLWNMSRERQPLPEPVYMNPSLIRRDYESIKTDLQSDLERAGRRSSYQAKQLGMSPLANVGIAAGTQENLRKGKRSILDMQQSDMAANVGMENQAKSEYSRMKLQRDFAEGSAAEQFSKEKGDAMAGNVREIFGAKEAGLYRTSELEGIDVNREMDRMDADYNKLDKQKMLNLKMGYISRDDWYKMTPEEKQQVQEKLQG